MLKNLYLVCGVVALALGCSGTSTEPNTFTGGGVLWNPEAGDLAVNTAVYATTWPKGAVENGHWFWEVQTDVEDGGLSMIEWPVAPGITIRLYRLDSFWRIMKMANLCR